MMSSNYSGRGRVAVYEEIKEMCIGCCSNWHFCSVQACGAACSRRIGLTDISNPDMDVEVAWPQRCFFDRKLRGARGKKQPKVRWLGPGGRRHPRRYSGRSLTAVMLHGSLVRSSFLSDPNAQMPAFRSTTLTFTSTTSTNQSALFYVEGTYSVLLCDLIRHVRALLLPIDSRRLHTGEARIDHYHGGPSKHPQQPSTHHLTLLQLTDLCQYSIRLTMETLHKELHAAATSSPSFSLCMDLMQQ